MKKPSIFKRLFKTYSLILVIVLISIPIPVGFFINNFVESNQIRSVLSMSDIVEHWTGALHIDQNDVRTRSAFKSTLNLWSKFLQADIVITNNDGEVTDSTNNISSVPAAYVDALSKDDYIIRKSNFNKQYPKKVLTVGVALYYKGTKIANAFFNLPLINMQKMAMSLILAFLLTALVSMAVAFILLYYQSMKISRPISSINSAVRDLAAGNFGKRVNVESDDEIGQLASSFNFMANSIEDLERQRSSFISDVSHELRTPMTSISGFIEGILDGTIPPEKQDYYLNIVLDESKRLTKMVNDMLEMTKMTSNEYQLDITSFDINELIRTCIISLENRICEKNLDLNVDFQTDELKVLADKDAVKRVVLNLMDNAIKFSYPNTTIGISTRLEKHKVYVVIGNFGDGISSDDLSKIFNRFYKTDKSRTNEKSGAGLGLSFVRNILLLHKQSIWVESLDTKEGSNAKYTKFTFTLEKE